MIFIESLLIAVMVTIMIPIAHFIHNLILRRRKAVPDTKEAGTQPSANMVLESMLAKLQCETKPIGEEDNDKVNALTFDYQGGHFVATFQGQDESFSNTVNISYFACFSCKLEYAQAAERACNDVNSMVLPIKCTFSGQEDEEDSVIINLHASGIRLIDDEQGLELLKSLLSCFFFVQRTIGERFDAIKEDEPGDILLNRQPYLKSAYAIAHAELNAQPDGWNRPWFETPEWTVDEFIDRITGYKPEFDYHLYVNGNLIDDDLKSKFCPLTGSKYALFDENGELQNNRMSIQLVPQQIDADMPAMVNLFFSVTGLENRLYNIRIDYARPSLPVTPYRPEMSLENEPQTRSLFMCVHRGGPDLFKAEAEYMAAEEGLIERCLSGDAAYSLYWGRALYTDGRYLEAEHYLLNAFSIMSGPMQNPEKQSQETCATFYEICFFLGVTYYQLGRYRESYFYLDIIVHHHRLRWTQQYVLTLMAANDPRIASTLRSLLEMTENVEQDEPIVELREFIERQQIILDIRNGQTEKARQALEKMLEANPDSAFALHWLSKIL